MNNASLQPLVLKFGGSSMATPELIRSVAQIVQSHHTRNQKLIVVVSAMGKSTDELLALAQRVSPNSNSQVNRREMDMLLSTGERVSIALLCLALFDCGIDAVSLTGAQSGILTDLVHGEAQISEIRPVRIEESIALGKVVVVAGFQGVSRAKKEITTLGRGGSDTTAVALAVALGAKECLIYTDVAGVFSADPKLVPDAKALPNMTWNEASEAATRGSKVLHARCVELAWKHKMPLRILSTFDPQAPGTLVKDETPTRPNIESPHALESARISSISQHEVQAVQLRQIVELSQNFDGSKIFKEMFSVGLKPLSWTENSNSIFFLIANTQKALLPLTSFYSKAEIQSCTRICLIGIGLESYPSIYIQVQQLLKPLHNQVLRASLQPHAIEVIALTSITRELIQAFHTLV